MHFLFLIDQKIDLNFLSFEVVLSAHNQHHAWCHERQAEGGGAWGQGLDGCEVVYGYGDDGFEAGGDVSDEGGEYFVDEQVADYQV